MATVTKRLLAPVCACLLAASHCALAAEPVEPAPTIAPILKATGIEGGPCVVVGADDPEQLCSLTNNGRVLVHGITLDEAATVADGSVKHDHSRLGGMNGEIRMTGLRSPMVHGATHPF